jgi:hypothetical protein
MLVTALTAVARKNKARMDFIRKNDIRYPPPELFGSTHNAIV